MEQREHRLGLRVHRIGWKLVEHFAVTFGLRQPINDRVQILLRRRVISGDDLEASNSAVDLVHRLGEMGHLEFRELLSSDNN